MPRKIIIFKNIDHAIKELKIYNLNFNYPKEKYNKSSIILKSVRSNIFRAFTGLNIKPSTIYREWSESNFDSIIRKLKIINNNIEYNNFLFLLTDSFIDYWKCKVENNNRIIYGPAIKIINLLIKTIQESDQFCNNKIFKFMHVPFDEYSLKPLIYIINDLTNVNYKISIPKSVTMKFITNKELYIIIQNAISKLCKKANINPIVFDYWSWNYKH